MWQIVTHWYSSYDKWMKGKFEEIDAPAVEKFMEDGLKTL